MTAPLDVDQWLAEVRAIARDAPKALLAWADMAARHMEAKGRALALSRVGHRGLAESVDGYSNRAAGSVLIILTAGDVRDPDVRAMARVQDEGSGYLPGGEIRPRYAKYLAIPLPAAKAADMANTPWHLHPKSQVRLLRLRSRDGYLVLLNGEPFYVFVRSVVLRGTRYLRDAFDEGVEVLQKAIGGLEVRMLIKDAPALSSAMGAR